MEIITKNNKQYYRFKIGDEFKNKSGESIEFSKLEKLNIVNLNYNEKKDFIYPCYSGVTKGNHIVGFSKKYNVNEKAIKISGVGAGAGDTAYIKEKSHLLKNCYGIISNKFSNEYVALLLQKELKKFVQGSTMPSLQFGYIKDEYIEIPINHEELSQVIKRILEYKQLSKQMKDYKLAILQQSEKEIKHWKKTGQKDKYINFKIGDEFKCQLGTDKRHWGKVEEQYKSYNVNVCDINLGNYKQMLIVGLTNDTETEIYKYPFFDGSTLNNHIKGYTSVMNINAPFIKVSTDGDAGKSIFVSNDSFIGTHSHALIGNNANEFTSLLLNNLLPKFKKGTTIKSSQYSKYKDEIISIPSSHNELSKKIEQLNKWQIKVEETVKQMEKYIEGVLQMSLK